MYKQRTSAIFLSWIALSAQGLIGCSTPPGPNNTPDATTNDVTMDAPTDRGTVLDTPVAQDVPVTIDQGNPTDNGPPPQDVVQPDNGSSDSGPVPVGCNPTDGIECDGDWTGQCGPAGCATNECCSPQHGTFQCIARDGSGNCPAPDLFVDDTKITDNYSVEWRYFPPGNCAIVEGCVNAPGWRRLLRFDTWTPNIGNADMFLGSPRGSNFEYSQCHNHYHFNTYADYQLLSALNNDVAARGHKQAFCLEDFYAYPGTSTRGAHYTCTNQGIQMQFQDVYSRQLDCQWVDVTDVPQGEYKLRISINLQHILLESNYDNNMVEVPVSIPLDDSTLDPTQPCAQQTQGINRQCGWTREGTHSCTPGTMVRVGCSTRCSLGSCTGDTVMRVYEGAATTWDLRSVIAFNDDSGCGGGQCGQNGDCCSSSSFTCPASGQYTVLTAPYNSTMTATCNVATSP